MCKALLATRANQSASATGANVLRFAGSHCHAFIHVVRSVASTILHQKVSPRRAY